MSNQQQSMHSKNPVGSIAEKNNKSNQQKQAENDKKPGKIDQNFQGKIGI